MTNTQLAISWQTSGTEKSLNFPHDQRTKIFNPSQWIGLKISSASFRLKWLKITSNSICYSSACDEHHLSNNLHPLFPFLGNTFLVSGIRPLFHPWEADRLVYQHKAQYGLLCKRRFLHHKVAQRPQICPESAKNTPSQNDPQNYTFRSARRSNSCYIGFQPLCFH